ncbi:hypothetical protein [Halopseudomonas sp.]|uniref:hypothetical protein n=1 Tax=Halopseudomonas sp. TaxID=2901191 RepID=UPI00311E2A11
MKNTRYSEKCSMTANPHQRCASAKVKQEQQKNPQIIALPHQKTHTILCRTQSRHLDIDQIVINGHKPALTVCRLQTRTKWAVQAKPNIYILC